MNKKTTAVTVLIMVGVASGYYQVEPWAATFVDDGPYFSEDYAGDIANLPIDSSMDLRRLGMNVYTLESRTLPDRKASVLVLMDSDGAVVWARRPLKPDGELGTVKLLRAALTWSLGWRIRIAPSNQEAGDLYVSFAGGFRFFNHSW